MKPCQGAAAELHKEVLIMLVAVEHIEIVPLGIGLDLPMVAVADRPGSPESWVDIELESFLENPDIMIQPVLQLVVGELFPVYSYEQAVPNENNSAKFVGMQEAAPAGRGILSR